jgi:DNA polymerase III sliding clamp (beta) subunit (PCNA family)
MDSEPRILEVTNMDIQVDRLRQVLDLVAAAIPRGRVTLPITTSVLFSEGKVTATNLEFWISVDLPELGDYSFVLPQRALTEALKFTPGRQMVSVVPDEDRVVLETPASRLSLVKPGEPQDFPPMPQPAGDGFVVDGDRLVGGFLEVLPYLASEGRAPVLTGVALKLDEELEMATADGYRLAIHRPGIQLSGGETGHLAVVPGNTARVLGQLWRKGDKPPDIDAAKIAGETTNGGSVEIGRLAVARRNLRMVEDGNYISFSFGTITLCSALIQGTFPRYEDFVPETTGAGQVMVNAEELLRAVNQVANIAHQGSNVVRLRWTSDRLVVSARAEDVGDVEVVIMPAVVEGGEAEIAFNLDYLQQYLRGKTHVVTIVRVQGDAESGRGNMGVFTHRGGPMVIMMPMLVQENTEQPPVHLPPAADSDPEGEVPPEERHPDEAVREEEQPAEPAAQEERAALRRRGRRRQNQEG